MGIIREPLDVDFVVDPCPLTKEEQAAISAFIKADKAKKLSFCKNSVPLNGIQNAKSDNILPCLLGA